MCLSMDQGLDSSGKDLRDPRVITNVGDVPIEEIRDCGVDDERLVNVITESVKLDPLRPLVLGGDHIISFPIVRAVSEKLGGQVDILHFDAHPDLYNNFELWKVAMLEDLCRLV
ncbi:arginase 1, mitochondrial [Trifolium repens]|nr:arginase 1, mitochondrial [Trifolium repens]